MSDGRREARQSQRIRMAARAASTAGSAMDVALAQIGAAFDEAAALNDFKLRVERALRRGPQHPAVRARFGARAERLAGLSLDGAVATVERWWRGHPFDPEIGLEISLMAMVGIVTSVLAHCLKRIEARLTKIESGRSD
jgi:hypothetical protein